MFGGTKIQANMNFVIDIKLLRKKTTSTKALRASLNLLSETISFIFDIIKKKVSAIQGYFNFNSRE